MVQLNNEWKVIWLFHYYTADIIWLNMSMSYVIPSMATESEFPGCLKAPWDFELLCDVVLSGFCLISISA